MIKGEKLIHLTKEAVLQRVSEYDIYRHFYGDFKVNEVMCNRFRDDTSPSFIIGARNGRLTHYDFGNSYWRGGCFNFVEQMYNCSFNEALHIIDKEMHLNIYSKSDVNYTPYPRSYEKQPEELLGKRYSLIQVVTRKFTKSELEYWSSYHQSIEDLRNNHVYSIQHFYLNKKRFSLDDVRFGYLYEGQWWKLYQPFSDKRKKWISNVPLKIMYGLSNLNKEQNTLVTKSMKDYLVCRKVFPNVCHVQNESLFAFSEENVNYIKENSKEVFIGFDSDVAGKQASHLITSTFGWKHINIPDTLLSEGCKDFADWAKCKGLDELKTHFINKKLI